MSNLLGFLYGYKASRDGVTVLEVIPPGSIGLGAAFVDVKTFGAKGDGVTDDTAAIQEGMRSVAGTGVALWFSPGTYETTGTLAFADATGKPFTGLTVWGSPDAHIHATIPGVGPQTAIFNAPEGNVVGVTTVAVQNAIGDATLQTAASVPVGGCIIVTRVANSALAYKVRKVAGAGPFTLTLDRPLARVFHAGDTVEHVDAFAENIRFYGNGMRLTGTAVRFIEMLIARDCLICDLRLSAIDGDWSDTAFSWDTASYRSTYENIHVAGSATCGFGSTLESAENCGYVDCSIEGVGATAAVRTFHATSCFARRLRCNGSALGLALTTAGPWLTTDFVYDADLSMNTTGLNLAGCERCVGRIVSSNNVNYGVELGATMGEGNVLSGAAEQNASGGIFSSAGAAPICISGMSLDGQATALLVQSRVICSSVSARACANAVQLLPGADGSSFAGLDVSNHTNSGFSTQVDATLVNVVADLAAVPGLVPIYVTGALSPRVSISGLRSKMAMASWPGGGVFYQDAAGGRTVIEGAEIRVCSNAGGGAIAGGCVTVRDSNVTRNPGAVNTLSVHALAGGTVRTHGLSDDTALGAVIDPGAFHNRGQVVGSGVGPVAFAFPDLQADDRVLLTAIGAGAVATPAVTLTPGTGFSISADATGSTYNFVVL